MDLYSLTSTAVNLVMLAVGYAIIIGISVLVWLVLSRPVRRQEQTRFLLHVLEVAQRQGRSLEEALAEIGRLKDPTLGGELRYATELGAQGLPLTVMVQAVPALWPEPVRALLTVGLKHAPAQRVLRLCRRALDGALCRSQSLQHGLVVFMIPALSMLAVLVVMTVSIHPKLMELLRDFVGDWEVIHVSRTAWSWGTMCGLVAVFLDLLISACMLLFIIPRRWLAPWEAVFRPWLDGLLWCVPWVRKRWVRQLSTLVALQLDAGVPEAEALQQASDTLGHWPLTRRVRNVLRRLEGGEPLPKALRAFDRSGEWSWRLRNALAAQNLDLVSALDMWHATLDAKADRQEQTWVQLVTSSLVLLNGLAVGLVGFGLFHSLARMISLMAAP